MSRPKCPNHTVEMDPTGDRRIWICPVSSARFECEVDTSESQIKYDVHGRAIQEWTVTSLGEE